jgi:alginate O-acetyltransferase complex protein AlgJ
MSRLDISGAMSSKDLPQSIQIFHQSGLRYIEPPVEVWQGQDFSALYRGLWRDNPNGAWRPHEAVDVRLFMHTIDNAWLLVGNGLDCVVVTATGLIVQEPSCFRRGSLLPDGTDLASLGLPLSGLDDIFVGADAAWHNYFHLLCFGMAKSAMALPYLPAACRIAIPDYAARIGVSDLEYPQTVYDEAVAMSGFADRALRLKPGLYRVGRLRFVSPAPSDPKMLIACAPFYGWFQTVRKRASHHPRSPRRVFLSNGAPQGVAPEIQALVATACAAHGFAVVDTSRLSLLQQINLFHNADCVVAFSGPPLVNILFGRDDLRILEINIEQDGNATLRSGFFEIASARGQFYLCLNVSVGDVTEEHMQDALGRLCRADTPIPGVLEPALLLPRFLDMSPVDTAPQAGLSPVSFSLLSAPLDEQPARVPSPADEVHVGKDGWLYLVRGTNNVLSLFDQPGFYTDDMDLAWRNLLIARSCRFLELGIKYLHVVVPDKLSLFPEYYQGVLSNLANGPLAKLMRAGNLGRKIGCLVDPTDVLRADTHAIPTFFKTDTHWTIRGAYLTYSLVCDRLGIPVSIDFDGREVSCFPDIFDLGTKINPPMQENQIHLPAAPGITRTYANHIVLAREGARALDEPEPGHHDCHVVLSNAAPGAMPQTVVIFGDSFSDYRPSSLTYLFAETFREVHFIWSTAVDFAYAARVGADVVISEIAERFMTRLPTDREAADALPSGAAIQDRMAS